MINLYQSRQGYNLRCFYKMYDRNDETIEYLPKGGILFYARFESSLTKESEAIGSGYLTENKTITISTLDRINDFNKNIECRVYIPKFKKIFVVEDMQVKIETTNLDVVSNARMNTRTYLRLSEYEE